jgi:WbqC-like protein family
VKIAIHQPEFLPWLGFFYKMSLAEKYIVLDHVQFKKRYFENRNKILSPQGGESWVSVPIISKGRYTQAINDVEIDNSHQWRKKFLASLEHYYGKSKYFHKYFEELRAIVGSFAGNRLVELNLSFIHFFRKHLNISCPLHFSSEIIGPNWEHRGSDLILHLCLWANADVYLCGPSGKDYLNLEEFSKRGIAIEWIEFQHPSYAQLSNNFIPYMSTLDLLFNHGEKSADILMAYTKN